METNQDKSVKAAKGSSTETEDSGEIEATEESTQSIEEQEEIEETLEAPEVPKETAEEETELEELPEEDIVEESEDITREPEAEDILEEEFEEEETRKIEKKEEIDEEIVEERIYTIPLRRAWISSRQKRTPRAVRLVKAFVQRHMKPETLVMSNEVNERLWRRSIQKPPRKIRVRAARDKEGTVTLYLAEGD